MNIIIIGSGIAGVTFAEKYRQLSPDAGISILTKENYGYYSRPMLSRGFTRNDIEQAIVLKPFAELRQNNIQVFTNTTVTGIDRGAQTVAIQTSEAKQTVSYDRLVIATGSAAFIPPPFVPYRDNFYLFNSLSDLLALRQLQQALQGAQQRQTEWAIIGGGLIGCELGSDLAEAGEKVSLFHAMNRLMERQLMADDSRKLCTVMQDRGVEFKFEQVIQAIEKVETKTRIVTQDGASDHDVVIVACGFKPRIALAQQAGLETGRGILVNQYLQTSDENIFALGDVAEFADHKMYAYIMPIRSQGVWLANYLTGQQSNAWEVPAFRAVAKVHGFTADHPFNF